MLPGNRPTVTAVTPPLVLTISCAEALARRCEMALAVFRVKVEHAQLGEAPTAVARSRPLAMVVPEDIYDFDPAEFDALARDVRAALVVVEDDIAAETLEVLFGAAIDAAIKRREKQGSAPADLDDPRTEPASGRATVPFRGSWADFEPPPPSQGAGRA